MGCLYQLTFPSGKSYIGITKRDANFRFNAHVKYAIAGKTLGAVHHAINKHGKHKVKIKTLLVADDEYLKFIEQKAILSFGTKFPAGYNLTDGGEGAFGVVRSAEVRKRMSLARIGKTHLTPDHVARLKAINTGRIKSHEECARISAATKGKKKSPEHIEKMRAINTGKKMSAEAKAKVSAFNKGKTFSEETRAKISQACRARWAKENRSNESYSNGWATRRANLAKSKQLEQDV